MEWANLIEELMPEQTVWITIEKDLEKGFDYRKITFSRKKLTESEKSSAGLRRAIRRRKNSKADLKDPPGSEKKME